MVVEAGLGVAAVPELAAPTGPHAILVVRPLIDPVVTRMIGDHPPARLDLVTGGPAVSSYPEGPLGHRLANAASALAGEGQLQASSLELGP